MNSKIISSSALSLETEALVFIVADRDPKLGGVLAEVDAATGGAVAEMIAAGDFSARAFEIAVLYRPSGVSARRLVLVGAGKGPLGHGELWRLAAATARSLKAKGVHQLTIAIPEGLPAEVAVFALATGVEAGNFDADRYRSDRRADRQINELELLRSPGTAPASLEAALRRAAVYAEAHAFARELVNEPSNRLTPTLLAQRAQEMARSARLECELIDADRAREMKMGAFLSVAQGSAEPPVLIVLRYRGAPDNAPANRPKLGLVGKGVTFDSGGISIKPAQGMEWMKCDMGGGAAVLGAMKAIAALKPPIDVIALVPAVENMPGGRAQKPGDVQVSMSGKTIEVLNTDAEGRMILADALTYAQQLGATHLVDAATLTGAVVVALGGVNTGVFANDENFYSRFQEAQQRSGEKMWRLPLDAEYGEQIKGTVGDILNTGGRWGGAITAAMFLKEFVGETPWIHLDIAGTAWVEENKPWAPKGPTGAAVYTLAELACVMSENAG